MRCVVVMGGDPGNPVVTGVVSALVLWLWESLVVAAIVLFSGHEATGGIEADVLIFRILSSINICADPQ